MTSGAQATLLIDVRDAEASSEWQPCKKNATLKMLTMSRVVFIAKTTNASRIPEMRTLYSSFVTNVKFMNYISSFKQGTSADGLLPAHEQTWRLRVGADVRVDDEQLENERRADDHRHQLRPQVRVTSRERRREERMM